jgi:hypothetical protein
MSDAKRKPAVIITTTEAEFRDHCNDNGGYCLKCGAEAFGCEPDARGYSCEECEAPAVYGAEECLLMGRVVFDGDGGE